MHELTTSIERFVTEISTVVVSITQPTFRYTRPYSSNSTREVSSRTPWTDRQTQVL